MLIHIVTEVDERPESMSSGPISAHVSESVANSNAAAFNEPLRGKVVEVGHYAQVFPITLDLTGLTSGDAVDCAEAAGYCGLS